MDDTREVFEAHERDAAEVRAEMADRTSLEVHDPDAARILAEMPNLGITVALTEGERQLALKSLAELSISIPEWEDSCLRVADRLQGRELFEELRKFRVQTLKESDE